jgi:non-ribosomal peptide synthetase component F
MRDLKALTQECGATMFMTMLAGLDLVCWKYARQRDLVIGSAIIDRNRPETENVIGYFLNMLLLRATIDPAMSFRQLLAQGKETAVGAYAHQDVPFATLVSELKPRQDASRNPLMQVSFIYLDFELLTTAEDLGFETSSLDVDNGASRFDLTLACWELPDAGIHSYMEYNRDLYDGARIRAMLRHLGRILEEAAAHPDRPLAELRMLDDGERDRLVVDFQPTGPAPETVLHAGVDDAIRHRSDHPALVLGGQSMTYAALDARARAVTSRLREAGVVPGDRVPVRLPRSFDQAAALLGVLRAGAAYVPVDPELPDERAARMLAAAAPRSRRPPPPTMPRRPEPSPTSCSRPDPRASPRASRSRTAPSPTACSGARPATPFPRTIGFSTTRRTRSTSRRGNSSGRSAPAPPW